MKEISVAEMLRTPFQMEEVVYSTQASTPFWASSTMSPVLLAVSQLRASIRRSAQFRMTTPVATTSKTVFKTDAADVASPPQV